jgi:gamma-glutamylcysteine synthetase
MDQETPDTEDRKAVWDDWSVTVPPEGEAVTDEALDAALRKAAADVIARRKDFSTGALESEAASKAIIDLGMKLGDTLRLMMPDAATRERLNSAGYHIDKTGDEYTALGMRLAKRVLMVTVSHENGESDDEAAIFAINAAIEDAALAMIGAGDAEA